MEGKKKQILTLIEELNFPFVADESKENLDKLDEEDLDILLSVYENIKVYRQELEKAARENKPDEYRKIKEEYYKKMGSLQEEYTNELEKLQKEHDEALESMEKEVEQKIEKAVEDSEKAADEIGQVAEDLRVGVTSLFSDK